MSREKEDLKRGMLNEQARGGKQASFSGVMRPCLSEVRDLATAVPLSTSSSKEVVKTFFGNTLSKL